MDSLHHAPAGPGTETVTQINLGDPRFRHRTACREARLTRQAANFMPRLEPIMGLVPAYERYATAVCSKHHTPHPLDAMSIANCIARLHCKSVKNLHDGLHPDDDDAAAPSCPPSPPDPPAAGGAAKLVTKPPHERILKPSNTDCGPVSLEKPRRVPQMLLVQEVSGRGRAA